MVAVAAHKIGHVALAPFVEEVARAFKPRSTHVPAVEPFALGVFPFVESLVEYEHSQLVAQVVQVGRLRVVRCAHGIATQGFERVQAVAPYAARHGRSEYSRVVVQAYAFHLHVLAVEKETFVGVEHKRAETCSRHGAVCHAAVGAYHGF